MTAMMTHAAWARSRRIDLSAITQSLMVRAALAHCNTAALPTALAAASVVASFSTLPSLAARCVGDVFSHSGSDAGKESVRYVW